MMSMGSPAQPIALNLTRHCDALDKIEERETLKVKNKLA
jgi:hypothetical protein